MPQTKAQEAFFSVAMACAMEYGMELYNTGINAGTFSNDMFLAPFRDMVPLAVAIILLERLVGSRVARHLLAHSLDPEDTPRLWVIVFTGVFTCCAMCPMMSLVATIAFKNPGSQLPAVWARTTCLNFPMALAWQLFVAGPFVRKLTGTVFSLQTGIAAGGRRTSGD